LGKFGSPESHEKFAQICARIRSGQRAVAQQRAQTKHRRAGEPVLLVEGLVERYLNHCWSYYRHADGSQTGEYATVNCALRPLVKLFGSLPADQFGPLKLDLVRDEMIARGWSRGYINAAVARICRCYTWAVTRELLPITLADTLRAVPGLRKGRTAAKERAPIRPVSDEVIEATLPELAKRCKMAADMVRIQRLCGCRPSELLMLTGSGIDRSDPEVWTFTPAEHKTAHHDKARVILFGPQAIRLLTPWLLRAGNGKIFRYKSRDGYRQAIKRAAQRAGQPEWFPNQLRHANGTAVRKQFGLEGSQVILGHSSADITQIYAERDLEKAREIARKIG
jgi:integrase